VPAGRARAEQKVGWPVVSKPNHRSERLDGGPSNRPRCPTQPRTQQPWPAAAPVGPGRDEGGRGSVQARFPASSPDNRRCPHPQRPAPPPPARSSSSAASRPRPAASAPAHAPPSAPSHASSTPAAAHGAPAPMHHGGEPGGRVGFPEARLERHARCMMPPRRVPPDSQAPRPLPHRSRPLCASPGHGQQRRRRRLHVRAHGLRGDG
jgi:hypothetical protein